MKVKWIAAAVVLVLLGLFLGRQLAPAGRAAPPEVPLPTEVNPVIDPVVADVEHDELPQCVIEILNPTEGESVNGYGPLKIEWTAPPPEPQSYHWSVNGPDVPPCWGCGGLGGTNYNWFAGFTNDQSDTLYMEQWPEGEFTYTISKMGPNGSLCTDTVHFTKDDPGLGPKQEHQDEDGVECNPEVERCG